MVKQRSNSEISGVLDRCSVFWKDAAAFWKDSAASRGDLAALTSDGHKMGPTWSKDNPRSARNRRRWFKIAEHGTKIANGIPKWPQERPGDPKTDPQDLRWPKNGTKMTPKDPQTVPSSHKKDTRFVYITISEPNWTLLQTFCNQLTQSGIVITHVNRIVQGSAA